MEQVTLNPGFESQASFRAVMDAMARPGETVTLRGIEAPAPLTPATAALIKSLADYETPVWLDAKLDIAPVRDWVRFHTGAPVTDDKRAAVFAIVADPPGMPDFAQFALGNEEYPDQSTTVIVQVARFRGDVMTIAGPGIKGERLFAAEPLPADFAASFANNHALFPRGVDVVLVADDEIAALPRSVRILQGL